MKTAFVISLFLVLLIGCTEDDSVQPPPTPVDPFEWCGNGDPDVSADMLENWPLIKYRITKLRISPFNGWWMGEYQRFATEDGETYVSGTFIYDPVNNKPIAKYNGIGGGAWSPDGKKLLLLEGTNILVVDIPTMKLHTLKIYQGVLQGGEKVTSACWSFDDTLIYLSQMGHTNRGVYSIKPDGSDKRSIAVYLTGLKAISTKRIIGVAKDVVTIINLDGSTPMERYFSRNVSELDDLRSHELFDVSRSGESIIFQSTENRILSNPNNVGIWYMDTISWKPKKIVNLQWWNSYAYPTWASSTTFYASIFCRKDSSSMIWEFDLNGEPIRQISTKQMNVWLE